MPDGSAALALGLLAAFCIGMSKAGFSGISLISVYLMAELHGAVASTGLMLPLLIVADLAVYPAFRRHGSWAPVWKLLPATLIGLLAGCWLLREILQMPGSDTVARRVIGACILTMVLVQAFRAWRPAIAAQWAESRGFGTAAGFAGGIATMLANAAGPVIQLYLLSRRIPKMELLGIGARFFLLVNILKVPLSASFALITPESLIENAKCLPGIFAGIWIGKWLVQRVSQRAFEWMVIGFSLLVASRLLLT